MTLEEQDAAYVKIIQPPKILGDYVILEHLHFSFTKKPNWFHRFFTKLFLGWEWKDFIN